MGLFEILTQSAPSELLYNFLLPFLLIFAILWGMLSAIKVFDKRINIVISLIITLLVANSTYFISLSQFIGQLGGYTALIAFGILFILGIGMYSFGKGSDIYSEHMPKWRKLKTIRQQKSELRKELQKAKDRGEREKMHSIYEQLKRLEEEEDIIMHAK